MEMSLSLVVKRIPEIRDAFSYVRSVRTQRLGRRNGRLIWQHAYQDEADAGGSMGRMIIGGDGPLKNFRLLLMGLEFRRRI